MTMQAKVSVATWRVIEAARVGLVAMPEHRGSVPRVAQIEQTLTPAIATLLTTNEARFAFDQQSKVTLSRHATHLRELHQRCLYWLTYVRMDVPGYEASKIGGRATSPNVTIERAHRVLTLLRSDQEPRVYAEQLFADLTPLYERSVRERDEADTIALEQTRQRAQTRTLTLPVHRELNTLRRILRNALGATHPHVRGLIMVAPPKPKQDNAAKAKRQQKKAATKPVTPKPATPAPTWKRASESAAF